jgi:lipopolysaccharide export system permease protein
VLFFITAHGRLELTIIKGGGISARQIVGCLLLAVSFIGVVYITIIDVASAISIDRVKRMESRLKNGKAAIEEMTITNRGIWFRDVSESRSYIIYAKSFVNKTRELSSVRLFEFNKWNDLSSSMFSRSASILNGDWILRDVKIIGADGREECVESVRIPTTLSFRNIDRITAHPRSISFWTMSKYIAIVEKVGLSSLRYRISWFSRLSSIVQMLALTVLASVFCIDYSPRRSRRDSLRLFALLVLAFPIHFADSILTAFGENGDIPALIAVFAVPSMVILACSRILLRE